MKKINLIVDALMFVRRIFIKSRFFFVATTLKQTNKTLIKQMKKLKTKVKKLKKKIMHLSENLNVINERLKNVLI